MPGSGKEEFVMVAIEVGIRVVRMGDVVRTEVEMRGLELTDTNIGRIADEERKEHGYGIWAERTLPMVKGDIVLIDGIRGGAELEVFKKAFGDDMLVLGVQSSSKTRYERIKSRMREDATMTWEAFRRREIREIEWGIKNAIALCDLMIINEDSLDDFRQDARKILRDIISGDSNSVTK
jgi:dephospho-CoA kinase